jgi:lambda family phage portal protein
MGYFRSFINRALWLITGRSGEREFEALTRQRIYPLRHHKTANDELRGSVTKLRELARDQEQNNPFSKRFLSLTHINVLGVNGITPKMVFTKKSGELEESVNDILESAWKKFSRSEVCEVSKRFSLYECQGLVLRSLQRDGEIFVVHREGYNNPFGYAFQLLEADALDDDLNIDLGGGRRIVMGIEVNEFGGPEAYYFTDESSSRFIYGRKVSRIPAEFVSHVYDPKRVSALRGYSEMAASINTMRGIAGHEEAEITAARLGASKAAFLERLPGHGADGTIEFAGESEPDDMIYEVEPGMIDKLPDGYTLKELNWDFPSESFPEFRKSMLRKACAGFGYGINYNDAALDYEGVNYTSLRAAYLTDRDAYAILQRLIVRRFLQPVWERFLKMGVLTGALEGVRPERMARYMEPSWKFRGWKWVDPRKETQALLDLLDVGLIAEDDIASERGDDLEDVYRRRLMAERLRKKFFGEKEGAEGGAGTSKTPRRAAAKAKTASHL